MKTAIALGTFDGLHKGHRAVISETRPYYSIAVTFYVPPKSVMTNEPQLLILPKDRENRLKELGINQVVMQDFDKVRDIEASQYVEDLCKKYNPSRIVCGFNYRFGKNALGNTDFLADFCSRKGIEFCCVSPQYEGESIISSTAIRECIKNGEVQTASKLLYGGFSFTAQVLHGDARGRKIGFPTANQIYPELLVKPKFGVYKSRVTFDGKCYDGVTNIGIRPTYKTDTVGCETYIKNFKGNIYGKEMRLELLRFMRKEQKFNSLDELKSAILNDVKLS